MNGFIFQLVENNWRSTPVLYICGCNKSITITSITRRTTSIWKAIIKWWLLWSSSKCYIFTCEGIGNVLEWAIDRNSLNHFNSQHREISVTTNFVSYYNDIQWHQTLLDTTSSNMTFTNDNSTDMISWHQYNQLLVVYLLVSENIKDQLY